MDKTLNKKQKTTKTKKYQRGGSRSARSGHSKLSNNNNNLAARLAMLKMPDVPDTLTTPIPRGYKFPDMQHYITELSRKQIPSRNQIDINTEQTILYNLFKLKNYKDEFSSLNTLYACVDLIINLINDKITQLSKLMPETRTSRSSNIAIAIAIASNAKIIRAWIEFFIQLRQLLVKEKTEMQSLIK